MNSFGDMDHMTNIFKNSIRLYERGPENKMRLIKIREHYSELIQDRKASLVIIFLLFKGIEDVSYPHKHFVHTR